MTTQYTTILKLALPVQGELSGTWGDVVNDNITQMVEQAIAGKATVNSWTGNSHTLTTADGTTSESRCAILELTDTGTALSGAGTVICPTNTKLYIVDNNTAQIITVKTSGGTGVAVPVGKTMLVYCDGTNVVEGVTHANSLSLGTSTVTADKILDEDNMASDSATAIATQQSIKAYVDSQVGTVDTLSEILANGNTTGANDIDVENAQKVQFRDSAIYINSSADGQLDLVADTEIQIAATTVDLNGNLDVSGTTVSAGKITADAGIDIDNINIDGTTIALSSGDLTLDVAGDIILDADGGDFKFRDGGAGFFTISNSSLDAVLKVEQSDEDFIIKGNDGGSEITALTLDMSNEGRAFFNAGASLNGNVNLTDNDAVIFGDSDDFKIYHNSANNVIQSVKSDADLYFVGKDGASDINALILDMSAAGAAYFNSTVTSAATGTTFNSSAAGGYLQVAGSSSNFWAMGSTGGTGAPTSASTSYGLHNWNGSAWSNPFTITNAGAATFGGEVLIPEKLSHVGDTDTHFKFAGNDDIRIVAGNVEHAAFDGTIVFNQGGSSAMDFRVESDTNENMLFVDAGNNRVGIGTGAPSYEFVISKDGSSGIEFGPEGINSTTSFIQFYNRSTAAYDTARLYMKSLDLYLEAAQVIALQISTTEAVINQSGTNLDFRVESDNNANMLFVDAGNDRIGVGTNSPQSILHLSSTAPVLSFTDTNSFTDANDRFIVRASSDQGNLQWYDDSAGTTANLMTLKGSEVVVNDSSADMDFRVEGTSLAYLLHVSDDTVKINANANGDTGGWTFYPTGSGSSPYLVQNKTSTSDTRAYAFQVSSSTKGSIDYDNNGTQFLTTSDRRLKMDIQPIVDGTEKLMAMNAVTHKWIENPEKDAVHGFIAQEMQEIAPESISGVDGGEEMMSMDYGRITPILVAALQDAHNKIKTLETRLATLEEK